MNRAPRRAILGLAACCFLGVQAAAGAATDVIPYQAFGYRDTIVERGPNAALAVYLPVTRHLRSVRLYAPIVISPQVDPRSTIVITANDVPVTTISVRSAGRTPTIDTAIPVPANAGSLSIALVGRLFVNGDICTPPRNDDVYFTVSPNARLTVVSDDPRPGEQIADFLTRYGGDVTVVNRDGDAGRSATIELAYRLHQLERWRRLDVRLAPTPQAATRSVVVGAFPHDLAVRGNELDVTPQGVALLDDRIDGLLIAPTISDASYEPATAATKELTIEQLGIGTRTLQGSGELPFDIPLTYGAFGGVPHHLRLHVDLVHTPIRPADRAYVQVLVNNTLIGSYDMTGTQNAERFDVPLDVDAFGSATVVRVVPTFFYERDACRGNFPSFTATLGNDTNFQWDGLEQRPLSVGEFVRAVSGKVVVLVAGPSLDRAAFTLLSQIGTVNADVRSIDVQPFDGSIPSGYDYAIVVGGPGTIDALKPPLQANGQAFSIYAADGTTVRYSADYSSPFAVLETAAPNGVPTLILTYWRDPAALAQLSRLEPDQLAAQTDTVLAFNATEATYQSTAPMPAPQTAGPAAISIPLMIGMFLLLLIAVVAFAARRKA